MANFDIQVITTKIILRNDVLENWQVSKIILEKGEAAIEFNPKTLTSKIKIGDGEHTFSELPYSTMTPEEIRELVKTSGGGSSGEGGAINSVELSSGTENGTLKITINGVEYDNIAVTGLGTAAFTDASDYATAEQGARAEISMVFKGFITELPSNVSVGDTFSVIANITVPASVSKTEVDELVVSGGIVTVDSDGKWVVVTSGISTASQVTTDNLVQGTKTIIFNGGSAAM